MKNLLINLCLIVVTPFYWLNTLIETFEGTPIFSFFIGCYITCKIIYESIFHSTDHIIIKIIGCTIYISIAWVLAMILSACEGLLDLIILLVTQPFCSFRLYLKRCLKTESAQRGQQTNRNASSQRQQSSSGARCTYRSAEDARRTQEEAKKREEEARKQEQARQEQARREKEEEEAATRRYEKARREFEEYMRQEFEKSEQERRKRMEEEAKKRREEEARRNRRPTKEQEIQNAMKILGLKPGFTKAELRSRRKELAKRYHPDVGGSPEVFKRINAAYDTLEKLCQ